MCTNQLYLAFYFYSKIEMLIAITDIINYIYSTEQIDKVNFINIHIPYPNLNDSINFLRNYC